jgi:hypothetical protein
MAEGSGDFHFDLQDPTQLTYGDIISEPHTFWVPAAEGPDLGSVASQQAAQPQTLAEPVEVESSLSSFAVTPSSSLDAGNTVFPDSQPGSLLNPSQTSRDNEERACAAIQQALADEDWVTMTNMCRTRLIAEGGPSPYHNAQYKIFLAHVPGEDTPALLNSARASIHRMKTDETSSFPDTTNAQNIMHLETLMKTLMETLSMREPVGGVFPSLDHSSAASSALVMSNAETNDEQTYDFCIDTSLMSNVAVNSGNQFTFDMDASLTSNGVSASPFDESSSTNVQGTGCNFNESCFDMVASLMSNGVSVSPFEESPSVNVQGMGCNFDGSGFNPNFTWSNHWPADGTSSNAETQTLLHTQPQLAIAQFPSIPFTANAFATGQSEVASLDATVEQSNGASLASFMSFPVIEQGDEKLGQIYKSTADAMSLDMNLADNPEDSEVAGSMKRENLFSPRSSIASRAENDVKAAGESSYENQALRSLFGLQSKSSSVSDSLTGAAQPLGEIEAQGYRKMQAEAARSRIALVRQGRISVDSDLQGLAQDNQAIRARLNRISKVDLSLGAGGSRVGKRTNSSGTRPVDRVVVDITRAREAQSQAMEATHTRRTYRKSLDEISFALECQMNLESPRGSIASASRRQSGAARNSVSGRSRIHSRADSLGSVTHSSGAGRSYGRKKSGQEGGAGRETPRPPIPRDAHGRFKAVVLPSAKPSDAAAAQE